MHKAQHVFTYSSFFTVMEMTLILNCFYQVFDVRNTLSHLNVDDKLTMGKKEVENSFRALEDLMQTLINLHPKYFQRDMCTEIQKV